MRTYDVTTIGSATQDIYVFSTKFHVQEDPRRVSGLAEFFSFGTKIELDDIFFEIGGGATNAAATFRNQDLRTACVARIGSDGAGVDVRHELKRRGIAAHLIVDRKERTGQGIIFLGRTGERTILVYRGATQVFRPAELTPAIFKKTQWVYLTSLGGNVSALSKAIHLAHDHKARIMINPGKREIVDHSKRLRSLMRYVDIVLVNREEATALAGRAYSNIPGMLSRLRDFTPGIIWITDGAAGAYYLMDKTAGHVIIHPVHGVDMTGAGDAFGSGFLAGMIRYRGNFERSAALAIHNAGAVIGKIGAKHGLLTKSDRRTVVSYQFKKFIHFNK